MKMRKHILIIGVCGLLATVTSFSGQAAERNSAAEKGFKSIFNGKDLSGWDGDPQLWSAKNHEIIGQTTEEHKITHNTFLIWTNGQVGDFELRCSFKITANNDKNFANSGIQYRSKVLDPKGWVLGGYQADMEAGPNYTGILYEERMTRGIMAARGEKVVWDKECLKRVVGKLGTPEELQNAIKKGEWNDYVVIAKGNHLQHFINGQQTVDVTDECESKRVDRGVLGLQLHQGAAMTVEFRNLRLKDLSGNEAASAKDLKKMQGTWQVAGVEVGGEAASPETVTNITVEIKERQFEVFNLGVKTAGMIALDSSKSPAQIEIHPEVGPDAGQVWPGIYTIENDSMKVCYSRNGKQRPTALKTGEDMNMVLITYNRKKG